jgi:galactokinase
MGVAALAERELVEVFVEATREAYHAVRGLDATIYVCYTAQGGNLVYPE